MMQYSNIGATIPLLLSALLLGPSLGWGHPALTVNPRVLQTSPVQSTVQTIEFPNGNTYVKLLDPKKVRNQEVVIHVPETLSTNDLMEVLITTRTLKENGASPVKILVEGNWHRLKVLDLTQHPIQLPLPLVFSVAGAESLQDLNSQSLDLSKIDLRRLFELRKKSKSAQSDAQTEPRIVSSSHRELAQQISMKLGIPMVHDLSEVIPAQKVMLICSPVVETPFRHHNDSTVRMLEEVYLLTQKKADVHVVSPYQPYARSDKKDIPGVIVTAKLMADLIQSMGAKSITFIRPHAWQSTGFYSIPAHTSNSYETLRSAFGDRSIDVVVAPDAGAQKDASVFSEVLGKLPTIVINKKRSENEISIQGAELPEGDQQAIMGKHALIIDDETSSGSTLRDSARLIKSFGAKKVTAVVTHLAGFPKAVLDSDAIDHLVVTDTIPIPKEILNHPKLKVISIENELSKIISEKIL